MISTNLPSDKHSKNLELSSYAGLRNIGSRLMSLKKSSFSVKVWWAVPPKSIVKMKQKINSNKRQLSLQELLCAKPARRTTKRRETASCWEFKRKKLASPANCSFPPTSWNKGWARKCFWLPEKTCSNPFWQNHRTSDKRTSSWKASQTIANFRICSFKTKLKETRWLWFRSEISFCSPRFASAPAARALLMGSIADQSCLDAALSASLSPLFLQTMVPTAFCSNRERTSGRTRFWGAWLGQVKCVIFRTKVLRCTTIHLLWYCSTNPKLLSRNRERKLSLKQKRSQLKWSRTQWFLLGGLISRTNLSFSRPAT